MGKKINPNNFRRTVENPDFNNLWYVKPDKTNRKIILANIKEDFALEKEIEGNIPAEYLGGIRIERIGSNVNVFLKILKPSEVIQNGGANIDNLKKKLTEKFNKNVNIFLQEIKNPETNARLLAVMIGRALEKRSNYTSLIGQLLKRVQRYCEGIRIRLSGRLRGGAIAGNENHSWGKRCLTTINQNIDHYIYHALTPNGLCGVKVTIFLSSLNSVPTVNRSYQGNNYSPNNHNSHNNRRDI